MTDLKIIRKCFNIYNLLILILANFIHAHFFKIWSGDGGWYWFVFGIFISISIVFWMIISVLSYIKRATLKVETVYFLIIGILQIILAIDYYKIHVFKDLPYISLLFYSLYFLPILISILPYFNIWTFHSKIIAKNK